MSRTDFWSREEAKMAAISEVMTRVVETIAPEASVQDAARLMSELNVGALPVCDGDALVGMITDRDITMRATASGRAPQSTAVAEVMTAALSYCSEGDSVDAVLKKMGDEQIRRIPVVDARQHLVGIVSLGDLATRQSESTEDVLSEISQPSAPTRR
jgi:CBS domain-containing protein